MATKKPELPTGTGNFQEEPEIPGGSWHSPSAGLLAAQNCWGSSTAGRARTRRARVGK